MKKNSKVEHNPSDGKFPSTTADKNNRRLNIVPNYSNYIFIAID